jgi:glycosyltransferase involved in cell wall biosynthesis
MSIKKVLIVFPFLPKYDAEFFEYFVSKFKYDIYITADISNTNDLSLNDYKKNNFTVTHTNLNKMGPFQNTQGLEAIITEISPHLIIYSASPRDLKQLYSIVKNKILGKKIAVWSMFHRIGGPRLYSTMYYKFLGFFTDKNMSYTNTGKSSQITRGIASSKIDVIGTAIDEKKVFEIIDSNNLHLGDIKEENKLINKFVLLQVLRLTAIKKPYFLIDMMKELVNHMDDVVLVLIGGGILEDDIKKYVNKNGLEKYVFFKGPIYDENILNQWFSVADLFVIPTCIGLSAHHACCYGLPIVTDNSIVHQASEFDILNHKLNCVLYEENSIQSFVDTILNLKDDTILYNRISQNAIATVKEIHTLESKANNLNKSIESIFEGDS